MSAKAAEIARETGASPQVRLFMYAVGNVGPGGHAYLGKDKLRADMTKVVRASGEISTYTERRLRALVQECVEAGLLAPVSTTRCLVLPMDLVSTMIKPRSDPCPEHGHWQNWQRGGWVSIDPDSGEAVAEVGQEIFRKPFGWEGSVPDARR